MLISAIVAMSDNRVIGHHNKLPWHLPADLQHFKKITLKKPILMGRKTFESIGRPLPERLNIVITRDKNFSAAGIDVTHSIEEALTLVKNHEEVFIIGGAELFNQTLMRVQRLYLTLIHQHFEGDTFFPELDKKEWREVAREDHEADEKNKWAYSFLVLERV